MFDTYHQAVQWLESTITKQAPSYMHTAGDKTFFLERTRRLFKRLGNPERGFQVVHVTGTSGKGSTAMMVYEMLRTSGKRVGLYTSPFVTTTAENIQSNGQLIAPVDFAICTRRVRKVVEKIAQEEPEWYPSYSEILFAIGVLYFQKIQCEWVVVEVSCGGRFDVTNIFLQAKWCVLTNIGMDHTDVLGTTLEEIAWHKTGIIQPGSTVFSAERASSIRKIIDAEAKKQGTAVHYVEPGKMTIATRMPGNHQQWNAALAAAVGEKMGLSSHSIANGIQVARLPARVELIQTQPRVIIDGAHSAPKMEALVQTLETFRPWKKLRVLFAAKESKNVNTLVAPLIPLADYFYFTSFILPGFGSHHPHAVQEVAHTLAITGRTLNSRVILQPLDALQQCMEETDPEDLVLITGSLYLAGEIRTYWITEELMLRTRRCFPQD
ncbi:MAG: hypothetical protein HYV32_05725 [Candidatus Kerfeldbacteria bacterium]|nr:hypothetical protein [Candidatus Kerfeldbacteria bacterium]